MEEQMLFFPLMTDGTLGLVENLYQRSHSKLFWKYRCCPASVLNTYAAQFCAIALVLILLLPLLLPRINDLLQLAQLFSGQ